MIKIFSPGVPVPLCVYDQNTLVLVRLYLD
jgi:hypothetical protein